MLPPVKATLRLISARRGGRAVRAGRRSRATGSSHRAAAARVAAWSRRSRRTNGRGYPSLNADVDSGELIAAQLPQLLVMHDPGDGSQVRTCPGEPPRSDQYLGRGQDAHHDSMGTCDAR
jgi:hypothetical protein